MAVNQNALARKVGLNVGCGESSEPHHAAENDAVRFAYHILRPAYLKLPLRKKRTVASAVRLE